MAPLPRMRYLHYHTTVVLWSWWSRDRTVLAISQNRWQTIFENHKKKLINVKFLSCGTLPGQLIHSLELPGKSHYLVNQPIKHSEFVIYFELNRRADRCTIRFRKIIEPFMFWKSPIVPRLTIQLELFACESALGGVIAIKWAINAEKIDSR